MARVTIEDCPVFSRFELVAISAQRARDISSGAPLTVARDKDKDTVVALREIASGSITVDSLRKSLRKRLECSVDNDDFLSELQDLCEDDILEDVNDAFLKAIEGKDADIDLGGGLGDSDTDDDTIGILEIP